MPSLRTLGGMGLSMVHGIVHEYGGHILLQSAPGAGATFRILIPVLSQVLNPASPFDKLLNCPAEYNELMQFLQENKITGVLFISGDRHHTEVIKVNRQGAYPLYDVTVSPLTAGTHTFGAAEAKNTYRVFGLDEKQNYGKFNFSGARGQRKLSVEFFGVKGNKLGEWSVSENELKYPRQ